MAKRTAADQFVDILLAAGVRRMYGVVGDSLCSRLAFATPTDRPACRFAAGWA